MHRECMYRVFGQVRNKCEYKKTQKEDLLRHKIKVYRVRMDLNDIFILEGGLGSLSHKAIDILEGYHNSDQETDDSNGSYDSSVHSSMLGLIERDEDSFSDSSFGSTSTYCDTTVISDTKSRYEDGFSGEEHARKMTGV